MLADLALTRDQICGGVIVFREGRHNEPLQVSSFVWWDGASPIDAARGLCVCLFLAPSRNRPVAAVRRERGRREHGMLTLHGCQWRF